MRLVTASLDYLRTRRQDEVVVFVLICFMLPSVFSVFYNFIQLLHPGDGIRRSLAIVSVIVLPGIIKIFLYIRNTYPYTSRLLSLLLSIIFCFTFILAGLYGEITSPETWRLLSCGGFYLLRLLYKLAYNLRNARDNLILIHGGI